MSKEKINIKSIVKQVKYNCNISDAKENLNKIEHHFLEHLYRNENGIKPEDEIDDKHFNIWLSKKKIFLKSFKNKKYVKIKIGNKEFDFSDNLGINKVLIPNGLFYRMKDSYYNKPSFLLAKILKIRKKGKYRIFILGKELARDLRTSYYSQCELLHDFIFCRYEAEKFYAIELIKKIKRMPSEKEKIIREALQRVGFNLENLNKKVINKIINNLIKIHISHEFGHAITRDKKIFPNELFMELVEKYKGTKIEWFVNSVHEIFADVINGGTLDYIIKQRNEFLFSLYAYDFISHYQSHPILRLKMKILFGNSSNLKTILQEVKLKRWNRLEKERTNVYKKMLNIVKKLKRIKANKAKINELIKSYKF